MMLGANAQQEAQYTQFMYNKLSLNPAYAGNAGFPCISCLHRTQWVGFEGAPSSQVINFHMPAFSNRVGLGGSIANDNIGPTNSVTAAIMYAYRIQLDKGKLMVGVRTSFRSYRIKWTELEATQGNDEDIPTQNTNKLLPNFGMGLYYDREKFYVGISSPNVLNNDLSYSVSSNNNLGRERRHFYLMTGFIFNINDHVRFKPAALIKYVTAAPMDFDLNGTLIFMDKLWTGVSYRLGGDSYSRLGESLDLLVQYQVSPAIRLGAAYDFTLSKIKNHSSGAVEVQLEYCFRSKHDRRIANPRFF